MNFLWAPYDETLFRVLEKQDKDRNSFDIISETVSVETQKYVSSIPFLYSPPANFLTPMIARRLTTIKSFVLDWFRQFGEKNVFAKYNFSPFLEPNPLLSELSPSASFLYSYLATLVRKVVFGPLDTPKNIACHYVHDTLLRTFVEIENRRLIVRVSDNTWQHNLEMDAARQSMQNILKIASFIYSAEHMTFAMKRDIERAKESGWQIFSSQVGERETACPCPVCSRLPNEEVSLPLNDDILYPFHFNCGRWVPRLIPNELLD